MSRSGLLLVLLLAPSSFGSTGTAAMEESPPVALYEDGEVSADDLEGWLRYHGIKDGDEGRSQAIRGIAVQNSLVSLAERSGLANQATTRMEVLFLETNLLEREFRRHLAEQIVLTSEELEASIEERIEALTRPEKKKIRNLLLQKPRGGDSHKEKELRRLVSEVDAAIEAREAFAELARRYSASQSRLQDGLIGWVAARDLRPEMAESFEALERGQVSPWIETEEGWTRLYCEDLREARVPKRAEVVDKAERRAKRKLLLARLEQIREAAVADAGVPDSDGAALGGVRLGMAELEILARKLGVREPSWGDAEGQRVFGEIAYRLQAARLARLAGLDRKADVALRLNWGRRSLIAAEVSRQKVLERLEMPGKQEMREYFQAHRHRFVVPETFDVAIIRKRAPKARIRALMNEMEGVAHAIASGEVTFEQAARSTSELATAAGGGQGPPLSRKQLASLGPTVWKAFSELDEGDVSGLIQQSEGLRGDSSLWILHYRRRHDPRQLSFEEAAMQVEKELVNRRLEDLQAEIFEEISVSLRIRETPLATASGD